mgnify:CR=1 FL=1
MSVQKKRRRQMTSSTVASILVSTVVAPQATAAQRLQLADVTSWPTMSVREFLSKAGSRSSVEKIAGRVKQSEDAVTVSADRRNSTLKIEVSNESLKFDPAIVEFGKPGEKIQLQVPSELADLALFVRDEKTLELRRELGQLAAIKPGTTELYAFSKGRMYILPVRVRGEASGKAWDMRAPESLFSLTGVIPKDTSSAKFNAVPIEKGEAVAQELNEDLTSHEADASKSAEDIRETEGDALKAPSLAESVASTTNSMAALQREHFRFYYGKSEIDYQPVTIQLIDDRSDVAAGKIYPVIGATVRVVGTDFVGQTDATGHLIIKDMPKNSRFLIRVDDPGSQVRSAVAEIASEGKGVKRLKMLRGLIFDGLSAIASTVQKSGLGSYCATITQKGETEASVPASGLNVRFDTPAEGPYYFNRFGYLDRGLNQTGTDGRVCFLNVTPGPAAVSIYRGDEQLMTQPVAVFVGNHSEDVVDLSHQKALSVQLASMATAQEQLSSDPTIANTFKHVDAVDIIPFGDDTPMMQAASGKMSSQDPVTYSHGSFYLYSRAAEFEPVVYSFRADDHQKVLPLIPRGFIEDLSIFAQVAHDSSQGAVLVHYSAPTMVAKDTVSMRLIDQNGRDVGDGWYFSDAPLTKAVFFNVPSGIYTLQVQTRDGYWLSSETVIVYNETTSFVQLGGELKARS